MVDVCSLCYFIPALRYCWTVSAIVLVQNEFASSRNFDSIFYSKGLSGLLCLNLRKDFNLIIKTFKIELFEQAKKRNTIIALGTSTGKTLIAVLLIKERSAITRLTLENGGQRTVFLVNNSTYCSPYESVNCAFLTFSAHLVSQQAEEIRKNSDLKVGEYCSLENGSLLVNLDRAILEFCVYKVSLQNRDHLDARLKSCNVLVMTAQPFLALLHRGLNR